MNWRGTIVFLPVAILLLLLVTACMVKSTEGLTVLAPGYLEGILEKAADQFTLETKIPVHLIYDNGANIISRAKSEARIDIVISNNLKRFTALKNDSLILRNSISCPFSLSLLVIGYATDIHLKKPQELLEDKFRRVVIVDPKSGYEGPLGQAVLQQCGIWDKIKNKTILAGDAGHLFTYLKSGEAEAGIVLEISLIGHTGFSSLLNLDEFMKEHLQQCGAIKCDSRYPESARAFLDFLSSSQCAIYKIKGIRPGA